MPTLPPPSLDWCLFLDVDGTLIELTDSPLETFADAALKNLLRAVAERLGGAVALVSGRSIHYLDALFAPLRLPAAGLHGVERRKASGAMHGASFVDAQLDPARAALERWRKRTPECSSRTRDERWPCIFGWRRSSNRWSAARLAAARPLLGSNYHIQEGSMMLEIKPRGFSKATAIKPS